MKFCISETEAKEKICHRSIGVRPVYHPTDGQQIRDGGPWGCIGSECMAWRWVRTNINDNPGQPLYESDDTHGYCGLIWKGE